MAREKEFEALILELLQRAGRDGLTLGGLMASLAQAGISVSERTVRRVLNELVQVKQVVTMTRKLEKGPGRPKRVYVLRGFLPQQLSLFELMEGVKKAEVKTLDELPLPEDQEEEGLLADEKHRRESEETESVLRKIATGQLEEEHLASSIAEIAPRLADEDPVDLLLQMLEGLLTHVNAIARKILKLRARGDRESVQEAEKLAQELEVRLSRIRSYFRDVWRLDPPVLSLPTLRDLRRGEWKEARVDRIEAERRLRARVLGRKVLEILDVRDIKRILKAGAGTDASVADIVLEHREGSFLPPRDVYAFTAAAALNVAGGSGPMYTDYDVFPEELRYYDDIKAAEKGYLLAPQLRELFGEEDLRHARYAALSLRQYDEDLRVLRGEARWRPLGRAPTLGLPPRIKLIVRDGRIFPTVHRLKDFEADNVYGRLVRNEIGRFDEILDLTRPDGPRGDVAYTAVVKEPEFSWLSSLVFWYLHKHKSVDIELVYRAPLPDNIVVHLLFLGLASHRPELTKVEGLVFCTFGMIRRFSDIALERDNRPLRVDGTPIDENNLEAWWEYIRHRLKKAEEDGREPTLDIEDYRPFVRLCAGAGVLMAYGAPCTVYNPLATGHGSGHFLIPRLEAAAWLEDLSHAEGALKTLLAWLADPARRTLDVDHARSHTEGEEGGLAPLVPNVIVKAHEVATFTRTEAGQAIEEEIRKWISRIRNRYVKVAIK